ncbi:hypothetical protein GW17_00049987 [Ensete ventricosum]|nr:hypothetical protein GW17_00049987 [Ensete ventricosum]
MPNQWRPMRDEEGKDNDMDTDVEWDPNLRIVERERHWRQKSSRGVGDGATTMLERQTMKGRVWSAIEERHQVFCCVRYWKRLLLLCFCQETEVVTLQKRSRPAAVASQKRSRRGSSGRGGSNIGVWGGNNV